MVRRFDPLRLVWHAAGRPGYGLNLENVAAVAAPYIKRSRPTKNGAIHRGEPSVQDFENDSHSHPGVGA